LALAAVANERNRPQRVLSSDRPAGLEPLLDGSHLVTVGDTPTEANPFKNPGQDEPVEFGPEVTLLRFAELKGEFAEAGVHRVLIRASGQ
jgi:hypothetical protein